MPKRVIHTTRMDPSWTRFLPIDNWCVFWDPPLVAQLCCLSHRCPMSHRPHCIAEDTSAHPGTTFDHSLAPWLMCLARHWPMSLVGPSLRGPPLLAVNDVRGLVGTQAPQSQAVNLFSEETKSSPWRPTWLCVTGREQCTEVTLLCARFNLRTRVSINGQDLTPLVLLCLR